MIPPPKYTPTALEEEGSFNQHHHHHHHHHHNDNNNILLYDETTDITAPPPAYCRQANQPPSTHDAESNAQEQRNIRRNRLLVPRTPGHLQQAYPPRSHRANSFAQDARAWNAYQLLNLNSSNSSGGARVSNPMRAPQAVLPRGGGHRSGGDVENYGLDGRRLDSPKFACESDLCSFFYLSYSF
jgi:hypothetical protein